MQSRFPFTKTSAYNQSKRDVFKLMSLFFPVAQLGVLPGTPGCSLGNMAISQCWVKAQLPPIQCILEQVILEW